MLSYLLNFSPYISLNQSFKTKYIPDKNLRDEKYVSKACKTFPIVFNSNWIKIIAIKYLYKINRVTMPLYVKYKDCGI